MVVLLTFIFFSTSILWFDNSYASVVTNERFSGQLKRQLQNNLLYQNIEIGTGIRIGDVGQLNILVSFVATLLCILHDVARDWLPYTYSTVYNTPMCWRTFWSCNQVFYIPLVSRNIHLSENGVEYRVLSK